MTDKPTGDAPPPDPATLLHGLFPGMAWTQAMLAGPGRVQAALAADTLRQLNAPVVEALAGQREFAELLAAAAQQLSAVAERTEQLARQHAALTEQLETAMRPYLEYVEWLERVGSGGAPDSPR